MRKGPDEQIYSPEEENPKLKSFSQDKGGPWDVNGERRKNIQEARTPRKKVMSGYQNIDAHYG